MLLLTVCALPVSRVLLGTRSPSFFEDWRPASLFFSRFLARALQGRHCRSDEAKVCAQNRHSRSDDVGLCARISPHIERRNEARRQHRHCRSKPAMPCASCFRERSEPTTPAPESLHTRSEGTKPAANDRHCRSDEARGCAQNRHWRNDNVKLCARIPPHTERGRDAQKPGPSLGWWRSVRERAKATTKAARERSGESQGHHEGNEGEGLQEPGLSRGLW